MVAFTHLLALLAAADAAVSKPLRTRSLYAVKEAHPLPEGWEALGPAPEDHVIKLSIAVKQGRFDELERQLYEVSDPSHPRYGKHLTSKQVDELVKPKKEALDLVHEWLEDHGFTAGALSYSSAKEWIHLAVPVRQANLLLNTDYTVFKHEDGSKLVRTPQWSLPAHLHEHIDTIQPTSSFFRPIPQRSLVMPAAEDGVTPEKFVPLSGDFAAKALFTAEGGAPDAAPAGCLTSGITPTCLRNLYKTANYKVKAPEKNRIGFTNYLEEYTNLQDVAAFVKKYRPDVTNANINFVLVNNGTNPQSTWPSGHGTEGALDGQAIIGLVYPTKIIAYQVGGRPPLAENADLDPNTNEPYAEWVQHMQTIPQADLPQVITTSYGDDELSVPKDYAVRVCQEFAKLGSKGVSVLFASGDNGVGRASRNQKDNMCVTPVKGSTTRRFMQSFPASCPYVTTVGGTMNFNPEVAAADGSFYSGGGFSDYFPQPAYQKTVVDAYVPSVNKTWSNLYNASGRAYPDIAGQSVRYFVIYHGSTIRVDGTSASTPAVASIFSLLNDDRIASGKPPLGFLNPWIYGTASSAFNDVTSGSARGCGVRGFEAQKGWDAVTGFGTPDFEKLLALSQQTAAAPAAPQRNVRKF
ncbi:tripeptidyl-peptidase 1 precursor [Trichodelitschia bisporula]|uniref:tripeptidyl-peptidase II n=1 Tax=Trichodelitschia bisporula TaxID=703511 RepID=A0A6G1I2G3_9PEZI|nr:tripeptidyl-peptidase 1 precursor [Trichodelitschia bisporula]